MASLVEEEKHFVLNCTFLLKNMKKTNIMIYKTYFCFNVFQLRYIITRILNFNHPNHAILEVGINFDMSLYFLEFEVLLFPRLGSVIFYTRYKYIHA